MDAGLPLQGTKPETTTGHGMKPSKSFSGEDQHVSVYSKQLPETEMKKVVPVPS